jgi:hypothetical protein
MRRMLPVLVIFTVALVVTQTIRTPPFLRNLRLDPTTHLVFVPAARFGPTPAGGRSRGALLADSFSALVVGKWTGS